MGIYARDHDENTWQKVQKKWEDARQVYPNSLRSIIAASTCGGHQLYNSLAFRVIILCDWMDVY
jgi:hypothetical protein